MKPTGKTIDQYLARVPRDQRIALEKLRRAIRAAAPRAEECISYGIPAFRLAGRFLVGFGAAAQHCSFYPGGLPIETYQRELKGYSLSKGTIRFPVERPLSAALVRKLVKARIAQQDRRQGAARGSQKARNKS
jgi:uncharacterized protein YdhG (YjbR/CyaY superfamily)